MQPLEMHFGNVVAIGRLDGALGLDPQARLEEVVVLTIHVQIDIAAAAFRITPHVNPRGLQ